MITNLFKTLPYLLVLMPIIGFFVDPNSPQWQAKYPIQNLILFPMILPWWGKIISIVVGIIWIFGSFSDEKADNA